MARMSVRLDEGLCEKAKGLTRERKAISVFSPHRITPDMAI